MMFTKLTSLWTAYKAFRLFVMELDAKGIEFWSDAGALAFRSYLLNNVVDKAMKLIARWPFTLIKSDDRLLRWFQILMKSERIEAKLKPASKND